MPATAVKSVRVSRDSIIRPAAADAAAVRAGTALRLTNAMSGLNSESATGQAGTRKARRSVRPEQGREIAVAGVAVSCALAARTAFSPGSRPNDTEIPGVADERNLRNSLKGPQKE